MTHEMVPSDDAPRARLSITESMATHYNMEPNTFLATMRATVFAPNMKREEEAAFLLVAKHHNLNPVTREIYAMPKKGGGIIPVVSIDGWVRMANEHPAFDGVEFEDHHDGAELISTTCRIYRKDRRHPIAVTEYLAECKRDTDPWKMKHRMLRHKAMIQCARYAFGFAGIYDPDEAESFAAPLVPHVERRAPSPNAAPMIEARPAEPAPEPARQSAPAPAQPARRAPSPSTAPAPQPEAAKPAQAAPQAQQHYDPEKVRAKLVAALKAAPNLDAVNEAWMTIVDPIQDGAFPSDITEWANLSSVREAELGGSEGAAP